MSPNLSRRKRICLFGNGNLSVSKMNFEVLLSKNYQNSADRQFSRQKSRSLLIGCPAQLIKIYVGHTGGLSDKTAVFTSFEQHSSESIFNNLKIIAGSKLAIGGLAFLYKCSGSRQFLACDYHKRSTNARARCTNRTHPVAGTS